MKYNLDIHHRRSIRLNGYDYSQAGLYFITVCTQKQLLLFGKIEDGKMQLNDIGKMINKWWNEMFEKYKHIKIDKYIVMPNHIHGIIQFVGAPLVGAPKNEQPEHVTPQGGEPPDAQPGNVGPPQGEPQNKKHKHGQPPTRQPQNEQPPDVKPPHVGPQNGQPPTGQPQGIAPTVGDVVGAFKSLTTNGYIPNVKQNNWPRFDKKLWQRNYYEHIIRDEKSYGNISEYIVNNPVKWQEDKYFA